MLNKLNFCLVFVFFMTFSSSCAHRSHPLDNDQKYMVGATLWFQRAAEVKALSHQAFNLAKMQLDIDLQWNEDPSPRAIIVDIDETILDNSPYQARVIINGKGFDPQTWENWVQEAQASPIPGAVEFMNYAYDQGIELFYITNRYERGREATIENLQSWGFPIESSNLLMRTDEHSKEQRRKVVEDQYRVVLLLGDQLEDFSSAFDYTSLDQRREVSEKYRDEFGHRFIVLPNPMYGVWERLLYRQAKESRIENRSDVWLHSLIPDAIEK